VRAPSTAFSISFIACDRSSSVAQRPRTLNTFLFHGIAEWPIFFYPGDGFIAVEAGPNAMTDLIFAPHRLANLEEVLVQLDAAAAKTPPPEMKADAFSRMVFPAVIAERDAQKYRMWRAAQDELAAVVERGRREVPGFPYVSINNFTAWISEKHLYLLCGPHQEHCRVKKRELAARVGELGEKGFEFDKVFPKTAAAYEGKLWMSYRKKVLKLCRGQSAERGVPPPGGVLAQYNGKSGSLQELLERAEALWPSP